MSAASPGILWHAKQALSKLAFAFAVFVIVSPAILVMLWMLSLSLKNEVDNMAYPPVFVPNPPTFARPPAHFWLRHRSLEFRFTSSIHAKQKSPNSPNSGHAP